MEMEELPMAADDAMRMNFSKKRKLNSKIETEDSAAVEFTKNEVSPVPSCTSGSDENDGGRKRLRSSDLKDVILQLFDGSGTEVSISGDGFLRDGTQTSNVYEDSSPPPPTELEEFFTAAESHLGKRFAKKYNYDIVKDIPMEGRFLWVRLHP